MSTTQLTPADLFQSLPRNRRSAPRPIERQLARVASIALTPDDEALRSRRAFCRRYAVLVIEKYGDTQIAKQPCSHREAMAYVRLFRSMAGNRGRKIVLAKLIERASVRRGRRVVA